MYLRPTGRARVSSAFTAPSFPAFGNSPYGLSFFALDPTLPPYSETVYPDGTPLPAGVIADPCKNPF